MRLTLILAVLALLAACAGNPSQQTPPRIYRISPQELDRLMPKPVPNLSLDEIVRLSQNQESPDAIIARIRESHSAYNLTPAQIVELNRKGVSMQVLDYIFNAQQQVLRDSLADEFNQRERKHQQEIATLQRQLTSQPYCDPFLMYPYPYGYPYWRRW